VDVRTCAAEPRERWDDEAITLATALE
jgi:hypothetical protein